MHSTGLKFVDATPLKKLRFTVRGILAEKTKFKTEKFFASFAGFGQNVSKACIRVLIYRLPYYVSESVATTYTF